MLAQRRILQLFAVFVMILALGWTAIANHGPFYCPDTVNHLDEADYISSKILHKPPFFKTTDKTTYPFAPRGTDSHGVELPLNGIEPNFAVRGFSFGRPIYYSFVLYADAILGTRWLTISMQALAVLFAIALLMGSLNIPLWPNLPYVTLALCVVSDVSFFVSFLKPDVFAAIGLLAAAVLITKRDSANWKAYVLGFLLLAISMVYCDTAAVVAAVVLMLSVAQNLVSRSWPNRRGIAAILLALGVTFVGNVVYSSEIRHLTGRPPLRLPFLEARLIGSGIGESYLRKTCPTSHFMVCDYVDKLPLTTSDFLFSLEQGQSVYWAMPYEKRKALGAEQSRFAFAVIRYAPLQLARVILHDIRVLLPRHELWDLTYSQDFRRAIEEDFPECPMSHVRATLAYRDHFPLHFLVRLYGWVALASVIYLTFLLFRKERGSERYAVMKPTIAWAGIGLALNVVICATLSGSFERFESRMLWLLPLLAFVSRLRQLSAAKPRFDDEETRSMVRQQE
jgi:hypothetical protein